MASLGPMSHTMIEAVLSQDKIGWRELMESNVSNKIESMQRLYYASVSCMMNGDNRMKHRISHILYLSHSQWIFYNMTLHNKVRGTLQLKERCNVLQEVERLADID